MSYTLCNSFCIWLSCWPLKFKHILTSPHFYSSPYAYCFWHHIPLPPFFFNLYIPYLRGFPGGSVLETWVRSLVREDPLEKEMATHSTILPWRIPWTKEPGRLQSTGSQRVGHDLANKQQQCINYVLQI